ncbi:hypothetical protein Bbelb_075660 [Branchiostoma belcheri]|nr:hypothetical protein Bbelb_075660 [Branchiostoma belcheri]
MFGTLEVAWNPSPLRSSALHSRESRAEERSGDKAFTDGFQATIEGLDVCRSLSNLGDINVELAGSEMSVEQHQAQFSAKETGIIGLTAPVWIPLAIVAVRWLLTDAVVICLGEDQGIWRHMQEQGNKTASSIDQMRALSANQLIEDTEKNLYRVSCPDWEKL